MLKQLLDTLQSLIETAGPLGIAFATFIESLIAPIPSEVVLVFTGTTLNNINQIFIYSCFATIGSYLGTLPFYIIARQSKEITYKFIEKYGKYFFIAIEDVKKAELRFKKNGGIITFTGRLIPGIRTVISIPAGISKMNIYHYTVHTAAGSFIWNILLLTSGYFLKSHYQKFLEYLDIYEKTVYILLFITVLAYLVLKYSRTKLKKKD